MLVCKHCLEINEPNFEICWNCQNDIDGEGIEIGEEVGADIEEEERVKKEEDPFFGIPLILKLPLILISITISIYVVIQFRIAIIETIQNFFKQF
tara:strand:+ start:150 stop:434 length:285 start_codon:yes stop_codon:yes gene_type:complete